VVSGDVTYVVDALGDGRVEIPDAAGTSQPTWSPDGSTIAFSAFDDGSPVVGVSHPGAESTFVAAPFLPFYFHWSPDGSHLAFLGNGPSGFVELGLLDAAALSAKSVDLGTPYYFDWSPDSDRLFSHAGAGGTRLVLITGDVLDVDDNAGLYQAPQWTEGGVVQLITMPATISARGLRFARQDSDQAIVVGPPEGEFERLVPIETVSAFDYNGRDLAFTDSASPTPIIRGPLMVASDGEIMVVTSEPVIAFEWSPDGRRLLFLEVAGTGATPEARWVVWERGEQIAFDTITPSVASLGTYFPFWDQYARSLTLWSPDGRAFVYAELDLATGTSSVFVQPVQSGAAPQVLGDGDWASWSS
jgi:TolB protein